MPHVDVAGGQVFCTVNRGPSDGPVVLLLHGAGGSRLNWPSELRRLDGATVYALDLLGHGRSKGQGHDTIAGYAEDVLAVLDVVDVERAVIAGHSMGGAVALTLALDSPDRVAGLVLIATGARLRVASVILEQIPADFETALDTITRYAWASGAPTNLVELGRERLRETGPDVLLDDLIACDRFDVMERLDEIDVPTLVVAGSADRLAPIKYTRYLVEHISSAQVVTIESAGHMVMLERSEETSAAVGEFLARLNSLHQSEGLLIHGSSVTD
jgi:pimeloyl-ACP methyl ester carboxylesterase